MSLPTPPEAPQKPAQKQEILSNVYLYDKNDTSPIPLTYEPVRFLLLAASGISLI